MSVLIHRLLQLRHVSLKEKKEIPWDIAVAVTAAFF